MHFPKFMATILWGNPHTRYAQLSGHDGGGGSPGENLKKRSQIVASDDICGKDIDL